MNERENNQDICSSCGSPAFAGHMPECKANQKTNQVAENSEDKLNTQFEEFLEKNIKNIENIGIDNDYSDEVMEEMGLSPEEKVALIKFIDKKIEEAGYNPSDYRQKIHGVNTLSEDILIKRKIDTYNSLPESEKQRRREAREKEQKELHKKSKNNPPKRGNQSLPRPEDYGQPIKNLPDYQKDFGKRKSAKYYG